MEYKCIIIVSQNLANDYLFGDNQHYLFTGFAVGVTECFPGHSFAGPTHTSERF